MSSFLASIITPPDTRSQSPHQCLPPAAILRTPHTTQFLNAKNKLQPLKQGNLVVLDGNSLDVPDLVAVAYYSTKAALSLEPSIRKQVDLSVETLDKHLKQGTLVYGVTTGFGGSADTRTTDVFSLQRALIQHQQSGILSLGDIATRASSDTSSTLTDSVHDTIHDAHSMPTAWVKASMLTRVNSIIRGHSGVRTVIAETILALLYHDITPVVPMRGSISASGDLSPLSYIAGAIEGHPNIFVRCGKDQIIMTAPQALAASNIQPVVLRAKEGLGLLNGTAFSAATASLAMSGAQDIAVISQILTAMGVEAMQGSAGSFHPKIAEMRPHPGQIESAANVLAFLSNSKLAHGWGNHHSTKVDGLAQDRYALRTASQWIGPQLEDLQRAQEQLVIELNSTTDNPLIDVESGEILHGGNFQAAVVTSAMDRARLALERLGRMLFAQATELINPAMNKGLPPNLCSDDPSLSFTCKGADINMAAYASELGFLANPVGSHVMSAEMHNQSINSLALISSRYTFQALDTVRMLCANYLFVVCQALDLRVLQIEFLKDLEPKVQDLTSPLLPEGSSSDDAAAFVEVVWIALTTSWAATTNLDLALRCIKVAESTISPMISYWSSNIKDRVVDEPMSSTVDLVALMNFTSSLSHLLHVTYDESRQRMYRSHLSITPQYLGDAAKAVYIFIRSPCLAPRLLESNAIPLSQRLTGVSGLGVAFHKGLIEDPLQPLLDGSSREDIGGTDDRLIGSRISTIYQALRDGRFDDTICEVLSGSVAKHPNSASNDDEQAGSHWTVNSMSEIATSNDAMAEVATGTMTSIGMTTSIGVDTTNIIDKDRPAATPVVNTVQPNDTDAVSQ